MPVRSAPLSHSRSASVDPMKPATPVTRAFITLAARGESPALHRERRGARLARRDDREYREYLREEQRSQARGPQRGTRVGVEEGCIAVRMQSDFHHGLLDTVPHSTGHGVYQWFPRRGIGFRCASGWTRYRPSITPEQRDVAGDAPLVAHICRVAGARFQDVPAAIRGAVHRNIRLAVTVEIAEHGEVAREAPRVADIRRVLRARKQDVPGTVRRTIHRDIG